MVNYVYLTIVGIAMIIGLIMMINSYYICYQYPLLEDEDEENVSKYKLYFESIK